MVDKKKKKKGLIILLVVLFLLGAAAGILYFLFLKEDKGRLARDENAIGGLLPGKTEEEIAGLLSEKVEEGMVDLSILAEPIFEEEGKKGRIGIENVPANHYAFQVDLVLDSTSEKIYSSGLIEPGFYIEYIELNKKLKQGDYPATATFTTYTRDEEQEKIAEMKANITLHVMEGKYYK